MVLACRTGDRAEIRVGFITNLTHAVPMVMEQQRTLERALGRPVRFVPFSAGPSVIEAAFARDVDFAYCGPGPAINGYLRSGGRVRVLAGAAYGGAAFVVQPGIERRSPRELRFAVLATPEIGNSQDIALRSWLEENGLASRDRGGTVQVMPMKSSEILSTFLAGDLDGAWVAEPWVSRLVTEAGGRVYLEESSLHPDGRYPTTLLVVTREMLDRHPREVAVMKRLNAETAAWIEAHPERAQAIVREALGRHAGKPLPAPTVAAAWVRLRFGGDPMLSSLEETARRARRLGYVTTPDITGILADAPRAVPEPAEAP